MSSTSNSPIRVTIVGGGLSGISQAIQLRRQLGNRVHLTIVEKEHAAGGTWLNSTWPGAGVDIPIHLYSLYSDPKDDWETVFADQKQVLDYLNDCIVKNGKHMGGCDGFKSTRLKFGCRLRPAGQLHLRNGIHRILMGLYLSNAYA